MKLLKDRIEQAILGNIENAIRGLGENDVEDIYMLLSIASDYNIKGANERLKDIIDAYRIPDEEITAFNHALCKMYLLGEHIKRDFDKASRYFDDLLEDIDLIKTITENLQGEELERFKYFFDENFTKSIKFKDGDLFKDLVITKNSITYMAKNPKNNIREDVIIGVPCFSIIIQYDVPLWQNSKAIAEIINKYVAFIPDNVLNTTIRTNGAYKKFTHAAFNKNQKQLIEEFPKTKRCFQTIYYGHLENAYDKAGRYFIELQARIDPSSLSPYHKGHNNQLTLSFPIQFIENMGFDAFEVFYKSILAVHEANCAYTGYYMSKGCTLQSTTWQHVDTMKVDDKFNYFMLGASGGHGDRSKVTEIGWLNYYGKAITHTVGGIKAFNEELPNTIKAESFLNGILIKTSKMPLYGKAQVEDDGYSSLFNHIHKHHRDLLEPFFIKRWSSGH